MMVDKNHSARDATTTPVVPEGARSVSIRSGPIAIDGLLCVPVGAHAMVIIAQGSGASYGTHANHGLPSALQKRGLATLLFDALTRDERQRDALDQRLRFDICFLARRLALVTDWIRTQPTTSSLPIGYLGAGAGAATALAAAADRPAGVSALVSLGGRPDLAGQALRRLRTTLLLVGSEDSRTVSFNELAMAHMPPSTPLVIVPGAGRRFEEPGALATVSHIAGDWLVQHLSVLTVLRSRDVSATHTRPIDAQGAGTTSADCRP